MVKVIRHKTALPQQTDGSVVFARWHQCALPCGHIGATWQIWLNLCFIRLTRVNNPNNKSISSAIFAQLTAECRWVDWRHLANTIEIEHTGTIWSVRLNLRFLRPTRVHNSNSKSIASAVWAQLMAKSPNTLQWATLSPTIGPSHGDLDPWFIIHDSLGYSEVKIQTASQSVLPFLHSWPQSVPMDAPFPQNYPFPWGDLDPHLKHGSLGLPESSTQTASRSVHLCLQGSLVWWTDRPTNRPHYSVGNNIPHTTVCTLYGVSEWVSSFLTAHQHILGYLVPYNGENVIKTWRYNHRYLATINMK